ncbi:sensor histidine kinase, partial [Streptomyces sp. WAC 04229]|uniref:sensor domain-containing protein n=1 Tax=Streptomyces sp. WAC 04229 TaxID=2203206 RepID=UPI000FFFEBDA
MHPRNAWQALSAPGFLRSAWPLRSAAYLVTGAVTGVVVLVGIVTAAAVGVVLAVVVVGLPLLILTVLAGIPVARLERHRLRIVDRDPAPDPHRPEQTGEQQGVAQL